jgi:hypothetical protein
MHAVPENSGDTGVSKTLSDMKAATVAEENRQGISAGTREPALERSQPNLPPGEFRHVDHGW